MSTPTIPRQRLEREGTRTRYRLIVDGVVCGSVRARRISDGGILIPGAHRSTVWVVAGLLGEGFETRGDAEAAAIARAEARGLLAASECAR